MKMQNHLYRLFFSMSAPMTNPAFTFLKYFKERESFIIDGIQRVQNYGNNVHWNARQYDFDGSVH